MATAVYVNLPNTSKRAQRLRDHMNARAAVFLASHEMAMRVMLAGLIELGLLIVLGMFVRNVSTFTVFVVIVVNMFLAWLCWRAKIREFAIVLGERAL